MVRALILSSNDDFAYWASVCLNVGGIDVHVMANRSWAVTRLSRHCQAYTAVGSFSKSHEERALLDRIEEYCRTHRVDWIVPADLPSTLFLGRGRDRIKSAGTFPISKPSLVERWNDKWTFGRLLQDLGLSTPRNTLLSSAEDPGQPSMTFPLMLKPLRGEGGWGVRFVASAEQLSAVLPVHGARHGWPLLAQEYIPGRDIDLSVLADRGRIVAWTVQQRRRSDSDLLDFVEDPRVLAIGAELIRACGYHGIVHFDMRLDERTGLPVVIEANPRLWGSCHYSAWMGVNFPRLGISLARGEDLGPLFRPVVGSCRDPGLSIKSTIRGFLRGRRGPEGLSPATQQGWRVHMGDPLPELWRRLKKVGSARRTAVL
jgi:predicted ATP-grasp superfamily ATP-dependent carboligase